MPKMHSAFKMNEMHFSGRELQEFLMEDFQTNPQSQAGTPNFSF